MMLQVPPFPRRPLDRRRMRGRGREPAQNRHALNAARHRLRKRRGERVYYLSVNSELLIDLLCRKGKLHKDAVHDFATIELALLHWVVDEINCYR